ncbi:MAG: hypothetical protein ACXV0U_00560 [Kineosporiaceae bacterium]
MDPTVPPPDDLDLSGAGLSVIWRAPGTHQALAVVADGVWFWTFASPSEPWADVAGSFLCEVSDAERAALLDLVVRIAGEGTSPGRARPGAGRLELLLAAGSRRTWVDAGSEAASDVQQATGPLLADSRPRAVNAVRLKAARMTPPAGDPVLGLTFAAIGADSSMLRLDPQALRLIGADGDWRVAQPPRMGLVDAAGTLLDGLYQAATVPAGGLGAWVIPGGEARGAQRVVAAGTLRVAGPIPAADVAFEVSAEIS